MKRILTAVALLSALSFSACKKTEVTQVIDNTLTIANSLQANQWVATDASRTEYVAKIDMPELDQDMNDNGGVLVYVSLGANQGNNYYDALPSTISNAVFTTYHTTGAVYIDLTDFNGGVVTPPDGVIPYKVMLVRAGNVTP
ncbi:MAG TPA: hypothetical protein VGC22_00260 [Chitinophaga sp.]